KALTAAVSLAQKTGGSLTIVTVTDPSVIIAPGAEVMMIDTGAIIADLEKVKAESAKSVLSEARGLVQSSGLVPKEVHISNSPAADGILRAAQEAGADLIVMGSHGRRGIGRLLLGSQASEVLAHASIPVLV